MQVRSGKNQLDAHHHAAVGNAPAVGMEHRRHRAHAVPRGQPPVVRLVGHQGMDDGRTVRIHHALRPPRGARGVAHGNRIVFLVRGVFEFFWRFFQKKFVIDEWRNHFRPAERHHDHLLEIRLRFELLVERQQDVVDDEEAVLGMAGDPADLVGRKAQVQRVHHPARRRNAEIALEMRVVVPAQRGDAVALLQSGGEQRGGELARAPAEIRESVPPQRLVRKAADDLDLRKQLARPLDQRIDRQRHSLHRGTDHVSRPVFPLSPGTEGISCRSAGPDHCRRARNPCASR